MLIEHRNGHINSLDDWCRYAAPKRPEHWKAGRSAFEFARSWFDADGRSAAPSEIVQLLASMPATSGATITRLLPEHRVRFDELRGEPRNADAVAIADHPHGVVAISIEAKADESFGRPVRNVLATAVRKIAADERTNVVTRVQQLAASLLPARIGGLPSLGDMRYQLLTAVAGALASARTAHAACAVFVVHEFETLLTTADNRRTNASDLDVFVSRLSAGRVLHVRAGQLEGPFAIPGRPLFANPVPLYVGKAVRCPVPLEPECAERFAVGYKYRERFPSLRLYREYEGGAVYAADGPNEYAVVTNETTMADLDDDVADICIGVYSFSDLASRDAYLAGRFCAHRSERAAYPRRAEPVSDEND